MLGEDSEDFGRRRAVLALPVRAGEGVVVVARALTEGAQEPLDRVAPASRRRRMNWKRGRCPLLALNGHREHADACLLLGKERT
jgi:hypothetical protein